MESFGKSSLKAERKEWENDPNAAASEEICNPYVRYGLNGTHIQGARGGKNLERVAFFYKKSHRIVHQGTPILKEEWDTIIIPSRGKLTWLLYLSNASSPATQSPTPKFRSGRSGIF